LLYHQTQRRAGLSSRFRDFRKFFIALYEGLGNYDIYMPPHWYTFRTDNCRPIEDSYVDHFSVGL